MLAARRVNELPAYVFADLDRQIAEMREAGRSVIDLGRADPDRDTPAEVVGALQAAAAASRHHHYPPFRGLPALRREVARWYGDRHGVAVDPETEVLVTAGSKEGLFHLALAACDPGAVALVPDPCFPTYRMGAYFAGAEVLSVPLRAESDYLPDLGSIPDTVARRARLLFLNYPNNPTGAVAPEAFFADAVAFAARYGILICHDLAYGESGYGGYRPPSVLRVPGAMETAVESITWSKAFCMPGWRLGAMVGCRQAVRALLQVQMQAGSGVFGAVQAAGVTALAGVARSGFLTAAGETYRMRRDRMVAALRELGFSLRPPRASPYLWFPCPGGQPSAEYARWLLDASGVALCPGSGFGAAGEGYLRLSLTAATDDIEHTIERLRHLGPERLRRADGAAGAPSAQQPAVSEVAGGRSGPPGAAGRGAAGSWPEGGALIGSL